MKRAAKFSARLQLGRTDGGKRSATLNQVSKGSSDELVDRLSRKTKTAWVEARKVKRPPRDLLAFAVRRVSRSDKFVGSELGRAIAQVCWEEGVLMDPKKGEEWALVALMCPNDQTTRRDHVVSEVRRVLGNHPGLSPDKLMKRIDAAGGFDKLAREKAS